MPAIAVNPFVIWFEILASVGIYAFSIFALPKLVCRDAESLPQVTFRQRLPQTKWLLVLHRILGLFVVFGALIGGVLVAELVFHSRYGAMALAFCSMVLWNGAFELITAISPKYGFIFRRWDNQTFLYGPQVRRLGLVRLGIGGVSLAIVLALIGPWGV